MEKREAIIKLHREGKSCRDIAKVLDSLKVTKSTAWYTIKRYEATKGVANLKKLGRPRTVRTRNLVEATRKKITRNPKRSMRQMVSEAGVGIGPQYEGLLSPEAPPPQ